MFLCASSNGYDASRPPLTFAICAVLFGRGEVISVNHLRVRRRAIQGEYDFVRWTGSPCTAFLHRNKALYMLIIAHVEYMHGRKYSAKVVDVEGSGTALHMKSTSTTSSYVRHARKDALIGRVVSRIGRNQPKMLTPRRRELTTTRKKNLKRSKGPSSTRLLTTIIYISMINKPIIS